MIQNKTLKLYCQIAKIHPSMQHFNKNISHYSRPIGLINDNLIYTSYFIRSLLIATNNTSLWNEYFTIIKKSIKQSSLQPSSCLLLTQTLKRFTFQGEQEIINKIYNYCQSNRNHFRNQELYNTMYLAYMQLVVEKSQLSQQLNRKFTMLQQSNLITHINYIKQKAGKIMINKKINQANAQVLCRLEGEAIKTKFKIISYKTNFTSAQCYNEILRIKSMKKNYQCAIVWGHRTRKSKQISQNQLKKEIISPNNLHFIKESQRQFQNKYKFKQGLCYKSDNITIDVQGTLQLHLLRKFHENTSHFYVQSSYSTVIKQLYENYSLKQCQQLYGYIKMLYFHYNLYDSYRFMKSQLPNRYKLTPMQLYEKQRVNITQIAIIKSIKANWLINNITEAIIYVPEQNLSHIVQGFESKNSNKNEENRIEIDDKMKILCGLMGVQVNGQLEKQVKHYHNYIYHY